VIIIPDDHEPPINAGHRSEQTSDTPQGPHRDYEALRIDMNTLFHHLGIQTAPA
jgi:hypothetical protein